MLQAKVLTVEGLKTRLLFRARGSHKSTVKERANSSRLNEVIMAKHNVNMQYLKLLQALVDRVVEDQTRSLLEAGDSDKAAIMVSYESGRRYDKVLVGYMDSDHNMSQPDVRFFVERSTGNIYGSKSELAPNRKWYFGNLATAAHWDWSAFHPTPTNLKAAGVIEAGIYGEYRHYELDPNAKIESVAA